MRRRAEKMRKKNKSDKSRKVHFFRLFLFGERDSDRREEGTCPTTTGRFSCQDFLSKSFIWSVAPFLVAR